MQIISWGISLEYTESTSCTVTNFSSAREPACSDIRLTKLGTYVIPSSCMNIPVSLFPKDMTPVTIRTTNSAINAAPAPTAHFTHTGIFPTSSLLSGSIILVTSVSDFSSFSKSSIDWVLYFTLMLSAFITAVSMFLLTFAPSFEGLLIMS